jgi:hypothetical protein
MLGGGVASLVALTGWKFVGAIALLIGIIAPTIHLLFEFGDRPLRRSQDGHPRGMRRFSGNSFQRVGKDDGAVTGPLASRSRSRARAFSST